ncbi:hypothetical protein GQ53DRAFT_69773 [Thozetella sp. PMI_491]|nr:hypothetical protein GQ53DRAFT_69773 [Thozetella sp. PMI_491]
MGGGSESANHACCSYLGAPRPARFRLRRPSRASPQPRGAGLSVRPRARAWTLRPPGAPEPRFGTSPHRLFPLSRIRLRLGPGNESIGEREPPKHTLKLNRGGRRACGLDGGSRRSWMYSIQTFSIRTCLADCCLMPRTTRKADYVLRANRHDHDRCHHHALAPRRGDASQPAP